MRIALAVAEWVEASTTAMSPARTMLLASWLSSWAVQRETKRRFLKT